MHALCWHGKHDVRYEQVPDPKIEFDTDAIIKVTACAICGSDLHLVDGYVPTMKVGDVLGHETMGEVVEIGKSVTKLKKGDRVVIPFTISCGKCWFCQHQLFSLCDKSNRNCEEQRKLIGHATAGLYGYSHMYGGFAGGQAEYIRVPFADCGPIKVPNSLSDEQVLFLSDIFPTGYMAAENAQIKNGDTVAIWGCGPVGQFTIKSAFLLGAGRVIAIDKFPERLQMAKTSGAEIIDFSKDNVYDMLMQLTNGKGPDSCIDAVGCEAMGHAPDAIYDTVKKSLHLTTDKAHVLREITKSVRKGGTLSIPGVYVGMVDMFMMGAFMAKGLTMKSGQTHVQKYLPTLLKMVEDGRINPSFIITHQRPLSEGPNLYKKFGNREDGCIKVMLRP